MKKLTKKQIIVIIILVSILFIAWLFIFPKVVMGQYPSIVKYTSTILGSVIGATTLVFLSYYFNKLKNNN